MDLMLVNVLLIIYHQLVYNPIVSSEPCDHQPLGMEDGSILPDQLSASSSYSDGNLEYGPDRARLNQPKDDSNSGAWSARKSNLNQWIQVNFGVLKNVSAVVTQGRHGNPRQRVTLFEVLYSVDGYTFESIREDCSNVYEFVGNSDQDTPVLNVFPVSIYARIIRIHPLSWKEFISMRFELIGCRDNLELSMMPLGIGSGTVNDEKLTASSELGTGYSAERGRLNQIADLSGAAGGGWSAATNDMNQWIQVDFGVAVKVSGVTTQGLNSSTVSQWVENFNVEYSSDGNEFQPIMVISGCHALEFVGNLDSNTVSINAFPSSVYAQIVRIHPTAWFNHISLRFDLFGFADGNRRTVSLFRSTTSSKACTQPDVFLHGVSCIRCAVACLRDPGCNSFKLDGVSCLIMTYPAGSNEYILANNYEYSDG